VEEDNKKLAARLEELRVERAQKETIASTGRQATVFTKERYNKLRERKLTLESQISLAEAKAATLKRSMLASNQPWPEQKKTLIHEMVQADARNSQLREKVGGLREDIDILRDKIGKLERRLNFTQGKGKPK
jgi:phage shock protein A